MPDPTAPIDSRTPVRVLWLIKGLGPGGAEQLLLSHARVGDHARFSYEVAYVVPWKNHMVAPTVRRGGGGPLHRPRPAGGVLWPWRVLRLVRSGRYDVVHAHSPADGGASPPVGTHRSPVPPSGCGLHRAQRLGALLPRHQMAQRRHLWAGPPPMGGVSPGRRLHARKGRCGDLGAGPRSRPR